VTDFDRTEDVVIVGSGAAGLVASLVVAERGMRPLVVEKSSKVGGSSSLSGGGLWIPNNPLMRAAGGRDSAEDALRYLDDIVGDVGPASSRARREAFVADGPELVAFLQRLGFQFVAAKGYPDYYPDRPGASVAGRCVEAKVFDGRKLGPWRDKLLVRPGADVAVYSVELHRLVLAKRTVPGLLTAIRVMAVRGRGRRLLGQVPMTMGLSLVGQLLHLNMQRGTSIWLNAALVELITENGRVVGAVVEREGGRVRVGAARGVMLTAGGFARNEEMRQQHHPHPITATWTAAAPSDSGDAIQAGIAVGAATALMDDAWWLPTALAPGGRPIGLLWERSLPGSIIVDGSGQRFMNESAPYVDCGHRMYERNKESAAIPAWLVIDNKHRSRYPFTGMRPGKTPAPMVSSGFLKAADTIEGLAQQIGIDAEGLAATTARFNRFAAVGKDDDFGRGANAYDRFYGDPRVKPNPNLAALDASPYYATAVYPGDLGTKGGLLTDEHARVLREDGTPIPGLYAAGNTTASIMGRTYAGPGATLGPAVVFAHLGVLHATNPPAAAD
jgi:3-oxosteroid 1-dehydrogenase